MLTMSKLKSFRLKAVTAAIIFTSYAYASFAQDASFYNSIVEEQQIHIVNFEMTENHFIADFFTSCNAILRGVSDKLADVFYSLSVDYHNDDILTMYSIVDSEFSEYFTPFYTTSLLKEQEPSLINSFNERVHESKGFLGFNGESAYELGDYYISMGKMNGGVGKDVFSGINYDIVPKKDDSLIESKEAYVNNWTGVFEYVEKAVGGADKDYFYQVMSAFGGAGDDTILGAKRANAGSGNDYIVSTFNSYGESGNDYIIGGGYLQEHHFGGDGNDTVMGGKGADIIFGGTGDDFLSDRYDSMIPAPSYTISYIDGGEGIDHLRLLITESDHYIYSGQGTVNYQKKFDNLDSLPSSLLVKANQTADNYKLSYQHRIFGEHNQMPAIHINNVEKISIRNKSFGASFDLAGMNQTVEFYGNQYSDSVIGTEVHDVLRGAKGDDTLRGGNGNDIIDGGSGNDVLYGGNGNDIFFPGGGEDLVKGNSGIDSVSYANATGIVDINLAENSAYQYADNLTDKIFDIKHVFASSFGGEIIGDTYNNLLVGDKGSDTLYGGDGNDLLDGRAGDDTLVGGNGNDTLIAGSGRNELTGGYGSDNFVISHVRNTINSTVITDFNYFEDKITLDANALGIFLENGEINLGYDDKGNARSLIFRSSSSELGFIADSYFSAITKLNVSNFDVDSVEFYKLIESTDNQTLE